MSTMDRIRDHLGLMLVSAYTAALVVAATACVLSGCGGAPGFARGVVNSGGVVLVETDRLAAREYRAAAELALEASESLSEYRTMMSAYDDVEAALRGAGEALRALDAVLDSWDSLAEGEYAEALSAVLVAFERLLAMLRIADVEAPDELLDFLAMVLGAD
jgi:hypothetical protein